METRLKRIRGETLEFSVLFFDPDTNAPIDVTSYSLQGAVRDSKDNRIADLPLVKQVDTGWVQVSGVDTTHWPPGILRCAIRLYDGTRVVMTENLGIEIVRGVF